MTSPTTITPLEARSRSLAEELEQLGTLFALTSRPKDMVREIQWASQTLNHFADHLNDHPHYPQFAHVVIDAVERTRIGAWRTAADLMEQQAGRN